MCVTILVSRNTKKAFVPLHWDVCSTSFVLEIEILLKFCFEPWGGAEIGVKYWKYLTEPIIIFHDSFARYFRGDSSGAAGSLSGSAAHFSLVLIFRFRLLPLIPSSFLPRPQIWVQHKHVTSHTFLQIKIANMFSDLSRKLRVSRRWRKMRVRERQIYEAWKIIRL